MKEFLNRLRILHGIDAHEIDDAMRSTGMEMTKDRWLLFRRAPAEFIVRADDATQRAIWSVIRRRETPLDLDADAAARRAEHDPRDDEEEQDPDLAREDRQERIRLDAEDRRNGYGDE